MPLLDGPVKVDGQTYSMGRGTSGYVIKADKLLDVDDALRLSGYGTLEDFYKPDVTRIREALKVAERKVTNEDERLAIKAVLVTHNETSTGVTNDLEAIARVVRQQSGLIYEQTPVERIEPKAGKVEVHTKQGTVHADQLVLATNAYSVQFPEFRRLVIPL